MKIGLLTFHRAANHGAVLQCLALQEKLKSLGHEVCVIDYHQEYIEEFYSPLSLSFYLKSRPNKFYYIKGIPGRIIRKILFGKFINKYLNMKPMRQALEGIDAVVIGSDQLWSRNCTYVIDPVYFGEFKRGNGTKLIGYAISCPLDLLKEIDTHWLKSRLKEFSSLSMREKEGSEYLMELNPEMRIPTTLDPTLLMPKRFYESIACKRVPEAVVVALYSYRLSKEARRKVMSHARDLAREYGCRVVDIYSKYIAPDEFLSWIRNAKVVVTNSFHATVFSLIFERKLCAVLGKDNLDSRYMSLLQKAGAINGEISGSYVDLAPDYGFVKEKIEILQKESNCFLSNLN